MMTRVIYQPTQDKLAAYLRDNDIDAEAMKARGVIVGTAQEVIDQMSALVDAGLERFMLQWIDLDDMDNLQAMAKDILPIFHQ
jgi:alkanesulfonate monooxygenase SsuD/methylene tetrahydromethanopterin reductase-like flavin-dependent oxidoreductase (luciferase family)